MKSNNLSMKKTLTLFTLSLAFIPFFASAQATGTVASSIEATGTPATQAQIFTACSQSAIDIRDSSIASARTTYNNSMTLALDARKESEKKAIAITDNGGKKEAIINTVNEYKKAVTQAQDALTQARKDAWDAFETNTQNCRDPHNDASGTKPQAATFKASNKASLRTLQATDQASSSDEVKTEVKSLGDTIKAQIDSIKRFFKF
jgi:hypothetical protein